MPLDQVRVTASLPRGGAAFTNFYFGASTPANLSALGAFYTALKSLYQSTITWTIPGSGNTISELNGKLLGSWSAAAPAPVAGTASASGSDLSGLLITWQGATVVDNHRPQGKFMLVPISSLAYAADGSITTATVNTANAAAAAFLSASAGFAIWHRPVYNRSVTPPTLTRPGDIVAVASGVCRNYPTVLRSRRQ